jgi:glycine cleavage system H protein
LPEVGDEFEIGDSLGSVESVKAASDVYSPVSGTVVEINSEAVDNPGIVNKSAEDKAWFVKIKMSDTIDLDYLLNEADYKAYCKEQSA